MRAIVDLICLCCEKYGLIHAFTSGTVGSEPDVCFPGASGDWRVRIARHATTPHIALMTAALVRTPTSRIRSLYFLGDSLPGRIYFVGPATRYPLLLTFDFHMHKSLIIPECRINFVPTLTRLANVSLASDFALLGTSVLLSLSGVGGLPLVLGALLFTASLSRAALTDLGRLALLSALLWLEYSLPARVI
jgi:hypothetical protein